VPYALASGGTAAAFFFADPLRAGHPINPSNKVLWVVRFPRAGKPLTITARRAAGSSQVVRIRRPADSGPGEIYPSYIDLPEPGCWQLTLAWGAHRAGINVWSPMTRRSCSTSTRAGSRRSPASTPAASRC
jgi:hypothetical protein